MAILKPGKRLNSEAILKYSQSLLDRVYLDVLPVDVPEEVAKEEDAEAAPGYASRYHPFRGRIETDLEKPKAEEKDEGG